jgi:hypothetical protein
MKKLIVLLVLLAQLGYAQTGVTHYSKQTGNWSDPNTWVFVGPVGQNPIPIRGIDRVLIKDYTVVTLDMDVTVDSVWIEERHGAKLLWQNNHSLNNVIKEVYKDASFVGDVTNKQNGKISDGYTWYGFNGPTVSQTVEIKEFSRIEINDDLKVAKWVCRQGSDVSINWGKSLNKIKYIR